MGNEFVTMIVAANMAEYQHDVDRLRKAVVIGVPIGLLALAAGGWLLASRALRPIALITRTAAGMTASGLNRRIPDESTDADLAKLVMVINAMLDRLEKSFHQAARFSADAAHELQTPLTVLQGELERGIQQAKTNSDEQQNLANLLEEVQRLKAITQKLLLLARADTGQLPLCKEDVNLSNLLEAAVEDVKTIAPDMQVECEIPRDVYARADAQLLTQAIHNMTSNAVKYNYEFGWVRFVLQTDDQVSRFTLSNTGVPIPEDDRERIFDRFYRVDKARSRQIAGAGLGLSLAREIARAHGGDLVLEDTGADLTSFTLILPIWR